MRLLWPKARVRRVTELTPDWLATRGLGGLVVDLDNTLVPYGATPPAGEALAAWNRSLAEAGIPVFIVSNAKPTRTRAWARALGLEGWGLAGKPFPWSLRRAVRRMGLEPRQVAVAGDQLFTDVLGANLIGAYSVLVEPIEPRRGLPHTRWVRALERHILERIPDPQNGGAQGSESGE